MTVSRQIHLARRPNGLPSPEDFALVERELPSLAEGEVEVEGLLLSVDPYMRPRLNGEQALGVPMLGGGIGRVVRSRRPGYVEGDIVRHFAGFQDRFVSDGGYLPVLRPDPDLPLAVYLHALGITGMTAYGGLLEVGALKDGEQVFVSAAAGAVGSLAAQIAKIKGCRVVGSTGSDEKAAWLRDDLGLDAVINYRTEPLETALAAAAPDGIDVYFENVGGRHLDAALPLMNVGGRIPVCGMISAYNGQGEGVRNLPGVVYKRVRIEGFLGGFPHLEEAFARDMTGWLKSGRIQARQTILEGFERAAEGLIGVLEGRNTGKMLIRLAD